MKPILGFHTNSKRSPALVKPRIGPVEVAALASEEACAPELFCS